MFTKRPQDRILFSTKRFSLMLSPKKSSRPAETALQECKMPSPFPETILQGCKTVSRPAETSLQRCETVSRPAEALCRSVKCFPRFRKRFYKGESGFPDFRKPLPIGAGRAVFGCFMPLPYFCGALKKRKWERNQAVSPYRSGHPGDGG